MRSLWQWKLAMENLAFRATPELKPLIPNFSPNGMKTKSFLSSDRRTCTAQTIGDQYGMELSMNCDAFLLETVSNNKGAILA